MVSLRLGNRVTTVDVKPNLGFDDYDAPSVWCIDEVGPMTTSPHDPARTWAVDHFTDYMRFYFANDQSAVMFKLRWADHLA